MLKQHEATVVAGCSQVCHHCPVAPVQFHEVLDTVACTHVYLVRQLAVARLSWLAALMKQLLTSTKQHPVLLHEAADLRVSL